MPLYRKYSPALTRIRWQPRRWVRCTGPGSRDEHDADFRDVVVKVQRPDIASIVDVDLSALQRVGSWLMRYRPIREHADVPALLKEFSITLYEEIDYRAGSRQRRNILREFRR